MFVISSCENFSCTLIHVGGALMLSVGGMCPTLQASSNPGLFKIVSGCFGLPLGKICLIDLRNTSLNIWFIIF